MPLRNATRKRDREPSLHSSSKRLCSEERDLNTAIAASVATYANERKFSGNELDIDLAESIVDGQKRIEDVATYEKQRAKSESANLKS